MNKIIINDSIGKNINENIGIYFTVTLFFAVGIAAGAFTVKALNNADKQEMVVYLNRFFQIINSENVQKSSVLLQSVKNNFQMIFFIWILSITIVGVLSTLLITSFKGFIIGFAVSFLINGFGLKGFIFTLIALLPQNILYIPCLLIISAISLNFSIQIFRKKVNRKLSASMGENIFSYTYTVLMLFAVMCMGSLIEAYISPLILKSISAYMLIQ